MSCSIAHTRVILVAHYSLCTIVHNHELVSKDLELWKYLVSKTTYFCRVFLFYFLFLDIGLIYKKKKNKRSQIATTYGIIKTEKVLKVEKIACYLLVDPWLLSRLCLQRCIVHSVWKLFLLVISLSEIELELGL